MNTLLKTFVDLVSVYSPSGKETEFSNLLAQKLTPLVKVRFDKYGNMYCKVSGHDSPVFFSAHMDTVEPGKNIRPQLKNGFVQSDGTTILGADNKATIACMLETLRILKKSKRPHRTLEFVFTRSEEVGNYGAINFDYSLLDSNEGYCFDSVQPIGTIITASPFYERFDIKIIGKAAHASKPEEAINALKTASLIVSHIKLGKLDRETIMNIGIVNGGSGRNTIPEMIRLQGEIRSFSEIRLAYQKDLFKKKVTTICDKMGAKYNLEFVRENPGYKFDEKKKDFIQETIQIIKKTNLSPKLVKAWGVSDANIFNHKKMTCINLGDGVIDPHTTRERIKVKDMELLVKLMTSIAYEKK